MSPDVCPQVELDPGVRFELDPSFRAWAQPRGNLDLWEIALAIAPTAFSETANQGSILFSVRTADLDPRHGTCENTQAYTWTGERVIYTCPLLSISDQRDKSGDPWTTNYHFFARAKRLVHEAIHGLACRSTHLTASESGIMCGTPDAEPTTCFRAARQLEIADRKFLCQNHVRGGVCARELSPMYMLN